MNLAVVVGACAAAGAWTYVAATAVARLKRAALGIGMLAAAAAYAAVVVFGVRQWAVRDVVLLAATALAGSALARTMNGRAGIAAFSIVAAAVDAVSFYAGPMHAILNADRSSMNLLQYLVLVVPTGRGLVGVVGFGDLAVMTALYAALFRAGLGSAAAFLFPFGGLMLALVVGLLVGGAPALPFIAGGTLALLVSTQAKRSGSSPAHKGASPTLPSP